jgi:hypothetical protein
MLRAFRGDLGVRGRVLLRSGHKFVRSPAESCRTSFEYIKWDDHEDEG